MTISIANDYAAIAARIAELKGEAREDVVCLLCEGTGWILEECGVDHFRARDVECPACGNPERRPSP